MDKYVTLCMAANLDFRPFAVNPLGGFGPALLKVHQQVWAAKKEDALRMGVQLRSVEAQERRALEKLACEVARCFYRSIYINQTGRTRSDFAAPPQADRDADAHSRCRTSNAAAYGRPDTPLSPVAANLLFHRRSDRVVRPT